MHVFFLEHPVKQPERHGESKTHALMACKEPETELLCKHFKVTEVYS